MVRSPTEAGARLNAAELGGRAKAKVDLILSQNPRVRTKKKNRLADQTCCCVSYPGLRGVTRGSVVHPAKLQPGEFLMLIACI
jgi:hypothetical protein